MKKVCLLKINYYICFIITQLMENVTNNSHGRAATSFMHSSEDGSKNQPILKSELDEFLDDKRRALLITGGKANRKQRRKWAKGTKK